MRNKEVNGKRDDGMGLREGLNLARKKQGSNLNGVENL